MAAILMRSFPLWVKSGHRDRSAECRLYPRKRTSEPARVITFDAPTPAAWRYSPRSAALFGTALASDSRATVSEETCHDFHHDIGNDARRID